MCVQYREGCSVPWGFSEHIGVIMSIVRCSVPWGNMIHVGDILSTVGDVQYCGGYHDACGGYLEHRGGYIGIMMHVRGYHEFPGRRSVMWGEFWQFLQGTDYLTLKIR